MPPVLQPSKPHASEATGRITKETDSRKCHITWVTKIGFLLRKMEYLTGNGYPVADRGGQWENRNKYQNVIYQQF